MRKLALGVVLFAVAAAAPAQAADFASDFAQPAPCCAAQVPLVVAERAGRQRPRSSNELDQMADAGFGGAEITDVHHSITLGP